MTTHPGGLHHLHKRKRIHKKLEKFPHPNRFVRFIDHLIYVVAVIIPLMTIPQVVKIWINKSAKDLSLITWCAYLFSALCWLSYSITHKDKPLIANSIIWVLLEIFVIIGIFIYG